MAQDTYRGSSRIHWLVAGRFSAAPTGAFFVPPAKDLDGALAARAPGLRVRVPDRLGAGDFRELLLPSSSLRCFTLGGVVEGVPELRELRALTQRPPASAEDVASAVERIAGPGRLAAACSEAARAEPAGPAAPATGPAAAVEAFVKGVAATPSGPGAAVTRKLREAIEGAVFGTALDALLSEPARSVEASWRGLRMLLAACPQGSGIQVEALDAAPEDVARVVRGRPALDAFDEPDALFVVEPAASIDALGELADLAEEMLAPCVASLSPRLLGADSAADLASRAERGVPYPEAWEALRATEAARWLCAAVNPVALFTEGAGAFQRTAFGGAACAVAALLSQSYRSQAAFAGVVGKPGALAAPAARMLPAGPQKGTLAPTETFLSIPAQRALAAGGLLGLGSVLHSDRVVLSGAPMVSGASGAAPLPAQLLAGRIVRFARWAKRQIDPALPPEKVTELFQQAAGVFLFPGISGAAALGAKVLEKDSGRVLRVGARVQATHALVPLAIEFELPM